MRKTLLLIFFLQALAGASQPKKENAPVTIRGIIGIPRGIGSECFRKCFAGLYEANLSVNARLFNNFFAGIGYQNNFFKNNEFLKFKYFNVSIPYNTRLIGHSVFLKLGYDQFFDKGYVSYSLNTGYMLAEYTNVNQDTTLANRPYAGTKFNAPYLQPEIAVNFLADRSLSFSLILSYTTLLYHFDPKAPRFNHFDEVKSSSNRYFMNWINIGFGFNIHINAKK